MSVFKLAEPIEYGTKVYNEVILPDKLKAIHFKKVRPSEIYEGAQMIKFLSSCLNETEAFVEMLSAGDMFTIFKQLNEALEKELAFLKITTS